MSTFNNNRADVDSTTRKRSHGRKRWCLVVAILVLLTNPVQAQGPPQFVNEVDDSRFVNPANGHTYLLLDLSLNLAVPQDNTWENLEAEAVGVIGGHLVAINDAVEELWIDITYLPDFFGPLGSGDNVFIGLNDIENEGTFTWTTGEPLTHTNWIPGEPNDSNGEDVVAKEFCCSHVGDWNDKKVTSLNIGLVEVVAFPDPTELELIVDQATGAMTLNTGNFETVFDSYNITSAAGALDAAGWNTGNLTSQATGGGGLSADLDGDGDVDGSDFLKGQRDGTGVSFFDTDFPAQYGQTGGSAPGDDWEVLNGDAEQLFEAFLGGETTLAASSSLSIGDGYNTASAAEDLILTFSSGTQNLTGTVSYINGVAAGTAVPEPTSLALVLLATTVVVAAGRRRKHA